MHLHTQSPIIRRLLLLAGVVGVALTPLAGRLVVLAGVRGQTHLIDARQRLESRQWINAVRGRILDRKGRVLAEDRPTYDIALRYDVLSGDWARHQARRTARRLAGSRWLDMSADERQTLIDELLPGFDAHVDRAMDRLAERLGVARYILDDARAEIIRKVESRQEDVSRKRLEKELRGAEQRGRELSPEELRKAKRRANEPIAETRQAHTLLARVGDRAGFDCQSLLSESVELVITTGAAGERLGLPADRRESLPSVPGLEVVDATDRVYPLDLQRVRIDRSSFPRPEAGGIPLEFEVEGVAAHILGKLRDQVHASVKDAAGRVIPGDRERRAEALAADAQRRAAALLADGTDRGAYRERDRVGDTGVEGRQEFRLRGLRGLALTHLETGERDLLEPSQGLDVRLTIDAALQARVQAVMDPRARLTVVQPWHASLGSVSLPLGTQLHGAAVVIDVESGDVLAAVSTPTFSRDTLRFDPASLLKDELDRPLVNRAWGAEYPPGSIIKPLILCGAVQRGVYTLDERIACNGYLYENNPDQLRCLIWKRFQRTHNQTRGGDLNPVDAIGVSCNIFFYTLGRRLGPEGVSAVLGEFGVGSRFSLGAGYEAPGNIGSGPNRAVSSFDATLIGIGQGPVTWSPLHAADSYATLARSGVRITPRLLADQPVQRTDLRLDPRAVQAALDGLDFAVNNNAGTGHHLQVGDDPGDREPIFNVPGVHVWGKTGTADAPDLMIDPDADGPLPRDVARTGDHSWFVLLAGEGARPRYAVSVIIEYGGSGAKVSGPIANQILHALREEGYFSTSSNSVRQGDGAHPTSGEGGPG